MSIMDNMLAGKIDEAPFSKGIAIDRKAVRKYAAELIERFDVRPKNPENLTKALSGGNAQKIVVAREVDAKGKLLIAAQPTRGVDIGAIESIRNILNEVKVSGSGILLVSADLDEVLSLSDRVAVMYEGKIMDIIDAKHANKDNVGFLMMGGKAEAAKKLEGV